MNLLVISNYQTKTNERYILKMSERMQKKLKNEDSTEIFMKITIIHSLFK